MVENPRAAARARGVPAVAGEAATHRFRQLNEPAPLAVEATARGLPKAVLWRGAFLPVAAIHDSWRIDDEWWREEIARRYFVVELEGGRRATIYHDLARDLWYAQTYEGPRTSATQRKSTA